MLKYKDGPIVVCRELTHSVRDRYVKNKQCARLSTNVILNE